MGGSKVPEPFDVRTEHAEEAGTLTVERAHRGHSPVRSLEASFNCRLMEGMQCASYTSREAESLFF